jgi:spore coat protein CotF
MNMNQYMNQNMNRNVNQNVNPTMNQNTNQTMNQNTNQAMNQNTNQAMNQNTIQNPKPPYEPRVKGPDMNDRDRVNDILALEKYLTDSFNISAREASHPYLHQDVLTVLTETHQCQYGLFQLMFRKGHYKLEAEQQMKLDQTYQQFNNYATQFPYQNQSLQ